MSRGRNWIKKKDRKRKTKLNTRVAGELIILMKMRMQKHGSRILSLDLARLAYLAGKDFTKFPESLLDDPTGEVMLEVFEVASMIQDVKIRMRTSGIKKNWAEDFDKLLGNKKALKAKKIVPFARKRRY